MEDETAIVEPVAGWEWECPNCKVTHNLSKSEYFDGMPLTCSSCEKEFFSMIYGF